MIQKAIPIAAACAIVLGPAACIIVGGDAVYDLGPPDLAAAPDLRARDLGAPGDLVRVPDLAGFQTAPDPYMPGTPRLSIGTFYEGGFSTEIPIDNSTTHLYVYPNGNSVVVTSNAQDKVEGRASDVLTVAGGLGWFGLGVHWDTARDLGAYKALHLALKSSSPNLSDVIVGMNSPQANPQTAKVSAGKYGYKNDGAWHLVVIPLADLAAVNPNPLDVKQVAAPLVLVNAGAVKDGDALQVDNVYLE